MDNQPSPRYVTKSFYLLLCALLGILLFLVLQRAVSLIYYLLLDNDFNTFSLGMSLVQLQALNYTTIFIAVVVGAWYGLWLGLHWYHVVYEAGRGGLFHGFSGRWWHRERPPRSAAATERSPAAGPATTIRPMARTAPMPRLSDMGARQRSWEFDDLVHAKTEPKSVNVPVMRASQEAGEQDSELVTIKPKRASRTRKTSAKRATRSRKKVAVAESE
jgi:hypothetical protein